MPDIFFFVVPDVVPIYEVIRTFGAEQVAAKPTMMSTTDQQQELLGTALTLGVLAVLDPTLGRA